MDNDSLSTPAALDRPAPPFALPDLDGDLHSLEDYLGKIVILNFWSSECGWTERVDRELAPHLACWGADVALLPIESNDNERLEEVRRAAKERALPTLLLDAGQSVADRYGAVTTPQFFVVDSAGVLRYRGAFDDVTFRQRTPTRAYLVPAVDALLAGAMPDPADTPAFGCTIVRYEE
ncbi:MAG TPA: redoxin domain-containing protein [Armatimonadota bacterium]|jgi:peroxiredoxin